MIDAYWARHEEKEEIIEFIDYVFSKAHRPHDFATLLPKLYGENGDGAGHHFVVREDGKIAATVLAYPVPLHVGAKTLMTLGVGSVSTRPAARGKGYMKVIMDAVDARAQELGAVCAVLGGQRQRYEYFGYQHAGYVLDAQLEEANVRHALGGVSVDGLEIVPMTRAHVPAALALMARQTCFCARSEAAFAQILHTWNNEPFAVLKNGAQIGYGTLRKNAESSHVAELLLEDEGDFPAVMKRLCGLYGTITTCAAPWQRARAKWLAGVCEDYGVKPGCMVKVYRQDLLEEALEGLDGFMDMSMPMYIAPCDCV